MASYPRSDNIDIDSRTSALDKSYPFQISRFGNSRALEEPMNFSIAVEVIGVSGLFGLVIFQERVNITIADLDGKILMKSLNSVLHQ